MQGHNYIGHNHTGHNCRYECCRQHRPAAKAVYGSAACAACRAPVSLIRFGDERLRRITYYCPTCQARVYLAYIWLIFSLYLAYI